MRMDLGRGAARIRRMDEPRIPRWLHPILEVPLEVKLLGANLIIVGINSCCCSVRSSYSPRA